MNHIEFVVEQLQRCGHTFKRQTGTRGWLPIRCVFLDKHKGGDRTPSLRICPEGHRNLPAKCFSCNTKTSWNEIAKILGVDPIPGSNDDKGDPTTRFESRQEFAALEEAFDEIVDKESLGLPSSMIEPWTGDFVRNGKVLAHADTLKRLPTYRWFDPGSKGGLYITERILWPILIHTKSYGYTGRAIDPTVTMRWKNSDNFKATRLLFPYDVLPKSPVAILTEGPTSALRLVDRGLPAVCIFGANNWDKDYKIPLLVQKGVSDVIVAFDGDKAGNKARAWIAKDLYKHFNVHHFPVPEGKDPANMSSSLVKILAHHVRTLRKRHAASFG